MVELNEEAVEKVHDLEEAVEELEEKNTTLLENINTLIKQKEVQEKKNRQLQEQIDELLQSMQESQKYVEQAQKNSTLSDIKIEPKMYLKGMFEGFVKEKNALLILIEGRKYYYPLHQYQCKHLPVAGSRVLIFRSEEGDDLIYGFNVSKLIDTAPTEEATIKFFSKAQKRIKLHIENYGYVNFESSDDFWENFKSTMGDTILLKKIFIDGDIYFYIAKQGEYITDRNQILQILLKD
jgi:chromosome segregation ATPase